MSNNTSYTFYDGENTTTVDRQKQVIHMDERSGWSRSYKLTFTELLENAKDWDLKVDLNAPDEVIAEVATNIILANNAVSHNQDPFRFLPRTNKITDPRDKTVLKKFEALLDKYTIEQVIVAINEDKKQILKEALNKIKA